MSEWERRVVNEARTADRRRPRTWASGKRVLVPLGSVWLLGAIVVGLAATTDNPQILFFDPSFLSDHPAWYVGLISQLGVLGWAIAALSASWTAWFARHVGRPSAERFLRHGALATVVLLGDDLFGLHVVISDFLLIPKVVMQLLVIAPGGLWLVTFRRDIGRTRWPVLVAAVGALAASLFVERLTGGSMGPRATIAEDGAKFLGILAWAAYFALTSVDIARSVLQETHTKRGDAPADLHADAVAGDQRLVQV